MVRGGNKDVFDALGKLPLSRSGDRAPRVPFTSKVLVSANQARPIETRSINISRSGILLEVSEVLADEWDIGSDYQLTILPDHSIVLDSIECTAVLIRKVPSLTATGQLHLAMRFIN